MRTWYRNLVGMLALLAACVACDSHRTDLAPASMNPVAFGPPLKVQLRWGGGDTTTIGRRWDGNLHLDCGRILNVRFLQLEMADGDGVAPHRRDESGTTVHWRSLVRGDVDGVEATIVPCVGEPGSTMRVQTPGRQWTARLAWSRDDFVSLPVGTHGERLDIRIRAVPDTQPSAEAAKPAVPLSPPVS